MSEHLAPYKLLVTCVVSLATFSLVHRHTPTE
ncbi:hypothetical protein SNOG_11266 [Parastagonospora nodorum SN15]|uniref:Uncharacterized protein n=1 Tax=Phaeosphaeria nodorum (strain SN15 / ATCC MYA-4574 / FGSC 10173) TaxID=321614 RepID=Q0UAE8_PHANO|nr:hypothetical protein SNOG_11266 [Parastagonospora nodorum SN15]EAT81765.1 hypothetical protein SNOG_11266 [Parastagonospora nodorum SN15]